MDSFICENCKITNEGDIIVKINEEWKKEADIRNNRLKTWLENEYPRLKREYDDKVIEYETIIAEHNKLKKKHWWDCDLEKWQLSNNRIVSESYTTIKKYPELIEPERFIPSRGDNIKYHYVECRYCHWRHYFLA